MTALTWKIGDINNTGKPVRAYSFSAQQKKVVSSERKFIPLVNGIEFTDCTLIEAGQPIVPFSKWNDLGLVAVLEVDDKGYPPSGIVTYKHNYLYEQASRWK